MSTLTGKAGMLRHAAWLSRAGFIVLAFDFRSYGGSAGTQTTGGYLEQQDLEAAIRLAHERSVGAPVAVLGEGMGATVGLAVMARDTSLVALVADSPATSWRDGLSELRPRAYCPPPTATRNRRTGRTRRYSRP